MICVKDHYTKDCPHKDEVTQFLKGNSQPVVLKYPFPLHQQQMITQNPTPSQGGQTGHADASTSTHVLMMANEIVGLTTRAKTYDITPDKQPNRSTSSLPSTTFPSVYNGSLQIEKPISDNVLHPPKKTIWKLTFNSSTHVSQNYNIIEGLAQEPCAMLTLEVLQHCPSKRKILLSALGFVDPANSNCIMFNLDYFKTRLLHNLAFQIHTIVHGKSIHQTIIDEVASTCLVGELLVPLTLISV